MNCGINQIAKHDLEECPTYEEQGTLFCSIPAPFKDKLHRDVHKLKFTVGTRSGQQYFFTYIKLIPKNVWGKKIKKKSVLFS